MVVFGPGRIPRSHSFGMTRCAGAQGTGFARRVAAVQEAQGCCTAADLDAGRAPTGIGGRTAGLWLRRR
jgi:hypothetical protein